jgi:hypothetical protein
MRAKENNAARIRTQDAAADWSMTTWTYGLARRWVACGVTANVLDPGIVKGKSGSEQFEGPALMGVLMSHVIPFFAAAGMQRGAQQYVRLAADPALATVSGTYFVSGKEKKAAAPPSPSAPPCRTHRRRRRGSAVMCPSPRCSRSRPMACHSTRCGSAARAGPRWRPPARAQRSLPPAPPRGPVPPLPPAPVSRSAPRAAPCTSGHRRLPGSQDLLR